MTLTLTIYLGFAFGWFIGTWAFFHFFDKDYLAPGPDLDQNLLGVFGMAAFPLVWPMMLIIAFFLLVEWWIRHVRGKLRVRKILAELRKEQEP